MEGRFRPSDALGYGEGEQLHAARGLWVKGGCCKDMYAMPSVVTSLSCGYRDGEWRGTRSTGLDKG